MPQEKEVILRIYMKFLGLAKNIVNGLLDILWDTGFTCCMTQLGTQPTKTLKLCGILLQFSCKLFLCHIYESLDWLLGSEEHIPS